MTAIVRSLVLAGLFSTPVSLFAQASDAPAALERNIALLMQRLDDMDQDRWRRAADDERNRTAQFRSALERATEAWQGAVTAGEMEDVRHHITRIALTLVLAEDEWRRVEAKWQIARRFSAADRDLVRRLLDAARQDLELGQLDWATQLELSRSRQFLHQGEHVMRSADPAAQPSRK